MAKGKAVTPELNIFISDNYLGLKSGLMIWSKCSVPENAQSRHPAVLRPLPGGKGAGYLPAAGAIVVSPVFHQYRDSNSFLFMIIFPGY